ncbi:DUF5011 domain-containing protein [Lentilactobacillus parafarraginis]|nr:bacterial Ig-like domain-containing protein [Lentilactobacillus parafarraginis]TLQ15468.1 DUF5011 domain-containing protein [Lentilactobacillus parafarraginis]
MISFKQMGIVAGAVVFSALAFTTEPATAAKKVKVTSNVPISAVKVSTQNAALTGKNQIYTKAGVLKGAKQVTSKKQLKKLTTSTRSKDFFNVYRVATTNKKQVYYKVVSFEGKWRGWIYGGKVKGLYRGGIKATQTTKALNLSDDVRNAEFKLKNPGTAGADNTWQSIPWSSYHVKLKTKNSSAYADDTLRVTAARQLNRQYYGVYYYVLNDNHPEFNGWISQNALTKVEKPAPTPTPEPAPTPTPTPAPTPAPQVVTNTVTNTVTKTVTVPAENPLTINYVVHPTTSGEDQASSDIVMKEYQKQYADALADLTKNPNAAADKLAALGNDKDFLVGTDYYSTIRVSFDKVKNVVTINLGWDKLRQPVITGARDQKLYTGDPFDPKTGIELIDATGRWDSNPEERYKIDSDVNSYIAGTYHVVYTYTSYGITVSKTITVTVVK